MEPEEGRGFAMVKGCVLQAHRVAPGLDSL